MLEVCELKCMDCGQTFQFTKEDAEYYNSKSLLFLPKRCKACRLNKRPGQERKMYTYTCSECGGSAVVPFQSDGLRPVFCSQCFAKHKVS